jgi:UDP-GlcNAc:undecaprenyl-phosphate GlcNAc-1-phosphate transferase
VTVLGGLADDIYKLSPWQKILYQALAATSAAACGIRLFGGAIGSVGFILWSVLLSNAFNLIDGLDGLCTGASAFSLLALIAISGGEPATVILLAAALGFLPLNLRPARLFLGDTGAMLLGFSLSVLSALCFYSAPRVSTAASLLLMLALPLFDTAFATLRRIIKGRNPFSPDREHIHHRLVDSGLSHGRASLLLILLSGGFASLGTTVFFTGFSFASLILSSLLIFPTASVIIMGKRRRMKDKF